MVADSATERYSDLNIYIKQVSSEVSEAPSYFIYIFYKPAGQAARSLLVYKYIMRGPKALSFYTIF